MNTNSKLLLAIGGAITFLGGCYAYTAYPKKGRVDFKTDSPRLENAMLLAAQEWTDAGVIIAASVTVNINPKGIPIRWAKQEDLPKLCNIKGLYHGCTGYGTHANFDAIYVDDSIDDVRLRVILMHELIHVMLSLTEHTPGDGIFNQSANTIVITQNDLDWICQKTECVLNV